ncbi:MAG: hypothetical protein F4X39_06565 [Acidobacteriia bacterium]|nr:hypothetical protein [Terriglobia bacterium]
MTATLSEWYDDHGRHKIYAGGKKVDEVKGRDGLYLSIDEADATRGAQVYLGPANAREEKIMERDRKLAEARANGEIPRSEASKKKILTKEEQDRLMKMYREQVLKETSKPGLVQINGLGNGSGNGAAKPASQELVGVSGD